MGLRGGIAASSSATYPPSLGSGGEVPSPKGGPAQGQTAKPEVKRMLVQGGFTEVSQSLILSEVVGVAKVANN